MMFGLSVLAAWWHRQEIAGNCGTSPQPVPCRVDRASKGADGMNGGGGIVMAAYRGDVEEVLTLVRTGSADINDVNKHGSTALHLALQQRHRALAEQLIRAGADVNIPTNRGVTPLMVAVSCCSDVLDLLLERGADPLAMNGKRERARDMAEKLGRRKAVEVLARAEEVAVRSRQSVAETSRHGHPVSRCPECNEVINLGKLRRIVDRVAAGDETNAYVCEFCHSGAAATLMKDVWCHRAINNGKLRKEVTETWAVVKAIEEILRNTGLADQPESLTFVDLCCGKSLTAALLAHLYPGSVVIAVDRGNAATVPHFQPPLRYIQADIHAVGFAKRLSEEIVPGSPIFVCGMHLCGALSPCAVELASQLPSVRGLVLSPCCLPSSKLYDNALHSGTRDTDLQYTHWCESLADYISSKFSTDGGGVKCYQDLSIKSIKNRVVVGWRTSEVSKTNGNSQCSEDHPLAVLAATARGFATSAQNSQGAMLERMAANRKKREEWDKQNRRRDGSTEP